MANFLRGLYNSDGGHCKYIYDYRKVDKICLYNNNLKLLNMYSLLERYFSIVAIGLYMVTKAGSIMKRNGNNYQIDISRKPYVERFFSEIGFSIMEKRLGLKRRDKIFPNTHLFSPIHPYIIYK